ncbi:peptidoglycan DD-metalloendopeptidase family protein [Nocardioides sp. Root140]|uniref:peptidoglycan DD-metalloendopeptidase family protein n=1 Tax=Nocardioides sp. Root140 TaxID=1736460 RepID=UPI0006F5E5E9|nr:peptidoglycan DD-metalloendopeptidase family protein [Nocardioides sp. Root140]KQY61431.1 hypothetical protein ASD30_25570 [Nocardioides sp. Root140]
MALIIPLFFFGVVGLAVLSAVLDEEASANPCTPGTAEALPGVGVAEGKLPSVGSWSKEQIKNAALIIAAGAELKVPLRAQTIAVMTAIGESSLIVVDHGDDAGPDSRGLFQQRDNGAWGSYASRMDPRRSAQSFYRALLKIQGWADMEPTIAAHKTQGNRDPYHYAPLWDDAVKLVEAITSGDQNLFSVLSTGGVAECDNAAIAAGGTVTWPVPASLAKSDRHNYGNSGSSWAHGHTGTDFSVPCGTAVYAVHNGTIEIDTTQSWSGPWLVKVVTGKHSLTTWYAHMQKVTVKAGQSVTAGQQIGEVGTEGNSRGCHLHLEVHPKNGSIYEDGVNPSEWLAKNIGKNLGGVPQGKLGAGWRLASFNALGHSHTSPSGERPGWPDSVPRTDRAIAMLTRNGVDVVGLQEFQPPQSRRFLSQVGDQWGLYPGPTGIQPDNAIAWRKQTFRLVQIRRFTIPYFHGKPRSMPAVLLEHRGTRARYWVISVHNAANAHGPAQKWRDAAIAKERAFVSQLRGTGYPVFLTGDLNDRHIAFCGLTRGGLMVAAAGGTNNGRCAPPAKPPIDWIFGSGGVFTGYQVDGSGQGTVSDHPLVMASIG